MSVEAMKNLQQIKGVGKIISQRLVAAGIDSYRKVTEAGEEGLGAIAGLQARLIPSILAQAAALVQESETDTDATAPAGDSVATVDENGKKAKHDRKLAGLKLRSENLRDRVRELVAEVLNEKERSSAKKTGKRLQKEAGRLLKSLSKVEAKMGGRLKKTKNGLSRAEERLAALKGLGPNKLARGLKKARRPLKSIVG